MKGNLLKKLLKKSGAVLVIAALLVSTAHCAFAEGGQTDAAATDVGESESVSASIANGYFGQYNEVKKNADTEKVYELDAASAVSASGAKAQEVNGRTAITLNEENAWCEWTFNIDSAAAYNIKVNYLPDVNYDNDITINVKVDGSLPFTAF